MLTTEHRTLAATIIESSHGSAGYLTHARPGAGHGAVLVTALAVGAAGDALIGGGPLGLGGTLFALVLLGAIGGLGARAGRLGGEARVLMAVASAFACTLSWRASSTLAVLNLASLGLALALLSAAMLGGTRRGLRGAWFRDYAAAVGRSAAWSVAAAPQVALAGVQRPDDRGRVSRLDLGAVARALLITMPLLLLFGGLLTAADPVFARLVGSLFAAELEVPIRHLLTVVLFAWLAAGYLYGAVLAPRRASSRSSRTPVRIGMPEMAAALGSINVLFLAFVVVQLSYLFDGGAVRVAGMTYAEYARRGFFELVWVTALVLPVLLVVRHLIGRPSPRAERVYRALGGTMLGLVLMIVASAMYRMWMYQAEYGLTEQRLYASVFMWWIVGVLGLFAITVLQGRRRGLAFGALSSGWAVVAGLNIVNPDALIVRVNAARPADARAFDAGYAAKLSDDAAPALAAMWPRMQDDGRCAVAERLAWPARGRADDWRRWNGGRAGADRVSREPAVRAAGVECRAVATAELARRRARATAARPLTTSSPVPPGDAR